MAASYSLLLLLLSLITSALTSSMHALENKNLIKQALSSDSHSDNLRQEFLAFKKKYGKTYPTQDEDDYRFSVFISHLHEAKRNQLDDPNAIHGVTKFSDLAPEEFRSQHLNFDRRTRTQLSNRLQKAPILPTVDLPDKFDWRELGAVTAIKDQGACGSCWAFAAIAALEGAHFVANQKLVNLSQQQVLDCSHECFSRTKEDCNLGCEGGFYFLAYKYLVKAGGIELELDYPDTNTTASCKFNRTKIAASIYDYKSINPKHEDQYAANLVKYGPIPVAVDASRMKTYKSGVSCPPCTDELDHEMVLVGYGSDGHWIIKNSWGPNFGEVGYYRLCKGGLICNTDPLATVVIAAPIASYQGSMSASPSLQLLYMIMIVSMIMLTGSYLL